MQSSSSVWLLFKGAIPGGSDSKESTRNAGGPGSIPGLGRSPGEGNGYPLQFSCLGKPADGGAWQITVHGTESDTTERPTLSVFMLFIVPLLNKRSEACGCGGGAIDLSYPSFA